MGNKDIHEWLLDNNIDSVAYVINKKGKKIFIDDILEAHLKEQLALIGVSLSEQSETSVCDCGKNISEHWDDCCSFKCWNTKHH
jgi:hypothetical protein